MAKSDASADDSTMLVIGSKKVKLKDTQSKSTLRPIIIIIIIIMGLTVLSAEKHRAGRLGTMLSMTWSLEVLPQPERNSRDKRAIRVVPHRREET